MKAYPSFGISGHFVRTPNHSTFDHFGADVVFLDISAEVRSDVMLGALAFNMASKMVDVLIVLVRSFLLLQSG